MMTVNKTTDRVQDVSAKTNAIANLARDAAQKAFDDGILTAEMLQSINEEGGLFHELAIPNIIRALNQVAMSRTLIDSDLLYSGKFIELPAVNRFEASEKFAEGTTDGVKISYIGSNLRGILKRQKMVTVKGMTIRSHLLKKASVDGPIIEALGGKELVITSFAHMWHMMAKQPNGEEGDLLTNGYANVFYIPDPDDSTVIWAVDCLWLGGGWGVAALPISRPLDWLAGRRFFSR